MNRTRAIVLGAVAFQLAMAALNVALFLNVGSAVRWANAAAAVVCFGFAVSTTINGIRHERWMRDFNRKWGRE